MRSKSVFSDPECGGESGVSLIPGLFSVLFSLINPFSLVGGGESGISLIHAVFFVLFGGWIGVFSASEGGGGGDSSVSLFSVVFVVLFEGKISFFS